MLYAHFTRCDLPSEDISQSQILKNGGWKFSASRKRADTCNSVQFGELYHVWSPTDYDEAALAIMSGLDMPIYRQ